MQHTHCRRDTYIYDGDRGVCATRTKKKIGLFLRSAGGRRDRDAVAPSAKEYHTPQLLLRPTR